MMLEGLGGSFCFSPKLMRRSDVSNGAAPAIMLLRSAAASAWLIEAIDHGVT